MSRCIPLGNGEPVSQYKAPLLLRKIAERFAIPNENIQKSAEQLGIDRVTLYNKIKRYKLKKG